MSTTSRQLGVFGDLSLQSHSWARVDIGGLGGPKPDQVLRGADFDLAEARADARGKVGDLIGTYCAALYLVGRDFVSVVVDSGLTGVRFRPVEVLWNEEVKNVSLLQVLGRCGEVVTVGLDQRLRLGRRDQAILGRERL